MPARVSPLCVGGCDEVWNAVHDRVPVSADEAGEGGVGFCERTAIAGADECPFEGRLCIHRHWPRRGAALSCLDDDLSVCDVADFQDLELMAGQGLDQHVARVMCDVLVGISAAMDEPVHPFDDRPFPAS